MERLYVSENGVVYKDDLRNYTLNVDFEAHRDNETVHLSIHDKEILGSLTVTGSGSGKRLAFDGKSLLYKDEFEAHANDPDIHITPEYLTILEKLDEYPNPDKILLRSELTDTNFFPNSSKTPSGNYDSVHAVKIATSGTQSIPDSIRYVPNYQGEYLPSPTNDLMSGISIFSIMLRNNWTTTNNFYLLAFGNTANTTTGYKFLGCSYGTQWTDSTGDKNYLSWRFNREISFVGYNHIVFVLSDEPVYRTIAGQVEAAQTKANSGAWTSFSTNAISVQMTVGGYGQIRVGSTWSPYSPFFQFNMNEALDKTFVRRKEFEGGIKKLDEASGMVDDQYYCVLLSKAQALNLKTKLSQ